MSSQPIPIATTPPGAAFNYPNFFTFFSMISPFVVVLLLVLNSIINSNLKGFMYLFGVLILFFMVILAQGSVQYSGLKHNPSPTCQLFHSPLPFYSIPSLNSSIFVFTMTYIFVPMLTNNALNLPLVVILLSMFAMDSSIRVTNNCTTPIGVVLGAVLGLMWGLLFYTIISANVPNLVYYDDLISNKVACSRPTEQKFKCSVYNNGQLLKTL
jgi:hypothetical protein